MIMVLSICTSFLAKSLFAGIVNARIAVNQGNPFKIQSFLQADLAQRKPEYSEETFEARGEHARSVHTGQRRDSNPQLRS